MVLHPDLPEQHDAADGGRPPAPADIEAWLTQLPAGGEGSRALLDRLQRLNRQLLPPADRSALLDTLAPAVRARLDLDQHRIRGQRFPLPARSRQQFEFDQTLREEAALGALSVASDTLSAGGDAADIARAVVAALQYSGEYLLRSVQLYTPAPEGFWHNVHAAYALAERAGVADQAADGGAPVDQYKRILLFAVGHVHDLLRNDAERIYELLALWALQAELGTDRAGAGGSAFGVDLARPEPPRRLQLMPTRAAATLRVLDVTGAVAAAVRLQRVRGPAGRAGTVSRLGLERLLANWRQENLRRSNRRQRDQRVDAEVTLGMIRDRIEGRSDEAAPDDSGLPVWKQAEEMRDPYAGYVSHPWRKGQGVGRRDDAWSRSVERKSDAYFRGRSAVEASGLDPAVRNPHRAWRLLDIGPNGFGLEWIGRGSSNATVGELVALAWRQDGVVRWRVAAIRWLRFTGPTRFFLGAQTLAPDVRAGGITRPTPDGLHDSEEPALLVGPDPADQEATAGRQIFLPAYLFAAGDELELRSDDREFRVELGEQREETDSFALFDLAVLPASKADDIPEWEIL